MAERRVTIPDLPFAPEPARLNNPLHEDLRRQAAQWIEDYPEVYALFVRFATQMMARRRPFGIKLLAERVRWEIAYAWGSEKYKLNNNHTAYIARQLVADVPGLERWIKFREVRW